MTGRACAVAAPHASATTAAARSVRAGGNAIDAAIAAAFALTVVQPHYTSIGGDLIALAAAPDGSIRAINATGYAGRHADADDLAARYGASMPATGPDTITVPGAVGGLAALHSLGAALPWAANIECAIELAATGVPASDSLIAAIRGHLPLVTGDPGLSAVLAPGGHPLQPGRELHQPALARSLAELAASGPGTFYDGALAHRLVDGLAARGGGIDRHDLAEFIPLLEAPLTGTFRGHEVSTSAPNSQGFLLLETLGMLEVLGPGVESLGAAAGVLSEVFQLAARDRRDWLTDPRAMQMTVADLLAPARLRKLAGDARLASPSARRAVPGPASAVGSGDTVAVVTADTDGWAVCLIQSVFSLLGSGILEPATGILLHNRGSSFSLSPRSANRIAPGKRPPHTLMPVMVRRDHRLDWIVGTMGGTRQPQIQTQLLLRLIGGATAQEALAAPRWVVEGRADSPMAYVERPMTSSAVASIGARLPVTWQGSADDMTGRAQIATVAADGAVCAVSDPRGEGSAQVIAAEPLG